jgi:hypothetical protein
VRYQGGGLGYALWFAAGDYRIAGDKLFTGVKEYTRKK